MQEIDLFVIGGGSGGVRAARMAGASGARVALAEPGAMGGTCVNLGCIPKKLYGYAAHYAEDFEDARGYGWSGPAPSFDWATLKRNRAIEILRLNGIYEKLLASAGVDILRGRARFADAHTIEVDGARFRATNILIATGGKPLRPEFPGAELTLTSNEIFDVEPFPRRLLVLGGGYIACEFASIFRGLGSQVTLLYRGEQVLRGFDDDVRGFVAAEMSKKGVELRLNARLASLERGAAGLEATLTDGSVVEADAVLAATGRRPNVTGLGLEAAGVQIDERGAIAVDDVFRTSVPHIYAVGDVVDRLQLTPVALAEAMVVVDRLFGSGLRAMDYEQVPTAVFTHPNVGTVGLTEAQARAKFGRLRIYRTDFKPLKHTLSGSTERTLMKLVVDDASDRVVGLHMVGADAGEILQGFAVAMKAGATKAVFDATLGIHPTAAEEFVTLRQPAG